MLQVYHNPRCSKSREALKYLEDKNIDFDTILYLKEPLSKDNITELLKKLDFDSAKQLVRTNEKIWKDSYKDKSLSEDEIIQAMLNHPKLIQRPIIVKNSKAVIGRPTENIEQIL